MAPEISLKVDVCNRRALEEGVPGLLPVLAEFGVRASFFVAFGPDNSGKAIRRIFRRGFVKKMIRTRGLTTYGFKTLLYGTLLPAPAVGDAFPDLLRNIESAGHEVGIHGWDHVGWHDCLSRMAAEEIRESYGRPVLMFERMLRRKPSFSGVPGWQVNSNSLRIQEDWGFVYASDCRGHHPFYPRVDGAILTTLQIPTTLPTSDEILGTPGINEDTIAGYYLDNLRQDRVNVLGLHSEFEGLRYAGWLRAFLAASVQRRAQFPLLSEIAQRVAGSAPVDEVVQLEIPGRAGPVACQKPSDRKYDAGAAA